MIEKWQPFAACNQGNGLLKPFYRSAVKSGLPVALWRFPRQANIYGVIDLSGNHCVESVDFKTMSPGFVMAPFQQDDRHRSHFLQANLFLDAKRPLIQENLALNHDTLVSSNRAEFQKAFDIYSSSNGKLTEPGPAWYTPTASYQATPLIDKTEYFDWIGKALTSIQKGELTKVVLSRAIDVELAADFRPLKHFCMLCEDYPNAFVSLVALPDNGTWIGATPELFLHVNSRKMTTVSLAGTQLVSGAGEAPAWGNKEIVEQEIVSDYIRNCFAEHDIADFQEHPLETVQIGNLHHLQTKFSYDFPTREKGFVNHFLQSMHPTPAVCGVSKDDALRFICEHELHQRSFYAGYLGPVNLQHESNFYVNLRCMQLWANNATLYAGGGITIDSVPENEWQETDLKLNALLKYFRAGISGERAKQTVLSDDRS